MGMLGRHEGLGNRGACGAIREQPTARVKKQSNVEGFRVFRLRSKAADLRTAFRILNADLMRYRIGQYTASQLIETYSKVEERIGQVEVDGMGNPKPTEPST
jgi:hypothetical protein